MTKRIISSFLAVIILMSSVFSSAVYAFAGEIAVISPDGYEETYSFDDQPPEMWVSRITQNSVVLEWDDFLSRADGYEIYQYDFATQQYIYIATRKSPLCKISNLKPGTEYAFSLREYIDVYGQRYYSAFGECKNISTTPSNASLKKVSYAGTGKLKAYWKKVSNATGYIIQYSTSPKFPEQSTCNVVVSKNKILSKAIGNLAKRTYYVRVCSYKQVEDKKYCGEWSKAKSVKIANGLSLKAMINATKTDTSGRKTIKEFTNNQVDIKKYKSTYDRLKAIYDWHAKNYKKFTDCVHCNSNFGTCVSALYGDKRAYDVVVRLAAGDVKNADGSKVMHKWPILNISGVPYIFDPRLQGYTHNYTGTDYFGLKLSSPRGKIFLQEGWYGSWSQEARSKIIR